ncbi:unnamed protein product [Protopolystoma xenopodis]|uniref:Uncharacterized protein n=1 Tax=Protopolystoma xenopodis TaxID=117903 RepID=A0A3S5FGW5_9PLAT|nr:unnamed protein product [Protopolystoma xenopodis]
MSGSDLNPWAVLDPTHLQARYYAFEMGRRTNCEAVADQKV